MASPDYVHGHSEREHERLSDQANTLAELLHDGTRYPGGATVLEAGCGVGAQTVTLARNSPGARFTSVDISEDALRKARDCVAGAGLTNVSFQCADILHLPFPEAAFDHVFVCFVLEHLPRPLEALNALQHVLKPGGTLTVIEGDHGSAYFHPNSAEARKAIRCLIELQSRAGGNSLIGRELYPLLSQAGFEAVTVSPRVVYVDASRPALVEGFTKHTFTAMVEGVRDQALAAGLTNEAEWAKGIADLYRTAEADGTFSYTFFKGAGFRHKP